MQSYQHDEESSLLLNEEEVTQLMPSSRRAYMGMAALSLAAVTLGTVGVYYSPSSQGFDSLAAQSLQIISGDVMCPGQTMLGGDYFTSNAKNVRLVFQKTGNLVIYESSTNKVYWASHTYMKAAAGAFSYLEAEGSFVVYNKNRATVWEAPTNTVGNCFAIMQNDGAFAKYCETDGIVTQEWTTGSEQPGLPENLDVTTLTQRCAPTSAPVTRPTKAPTFSPTLQPTLEPTVHPVANPTMEPTLVPTNFPAASPTEVPTLAPTFVPTFEPTMHPVSEPTLEPTKAPVADETPAPTFLPTLEPVENPTKEPVSEPTPVPTLIPTANPTLEPTKAPISDITPSPTLEPSGAPVISPTMAPVSDPTQHPTVVSEPTLQPVVQFRVPEPLAPEPVAVAPKPVAPEPVAPEKQSDSAPAPVKKEVSAPPTKVSPATKIAPATKSGDSPNYCAFTFTKGVSHFGSPKGCSLFAVDDLSYLKDGDSTKAFYGCATADKPLYITESELIRTGLMEDGKSKVTAIFPGSSVFITFYTNSDFTGYDYTFNSNYHFELTRFHFAGTDFGNDQIKSVKVKSLTSSFTLPDVCEQKFHL